jgi:protein-L-isoaspartate O-methyltransferase
MNVIENSGSPPRQKRSFSHEAEREREATSVEAAISHPGEAGGRRVSWDGTYTQVETPERMLRWVTTHSPMVVPLMECQRVLEVGTGTGMLSGFLAKAGGEVTTIDLSQPVLDVAGRFYDNLGVQVKTVKADGAETGFDNDSFDAVFSQGLWEHFTDQAIFRFAIEGLRLAPVVYASVPSVLYPRFGKRGPGIVGNERFMTASRWLRVLRDVDCRCTATYYADWKVATLMGVTFPYRNQLLLELRR